MKNIFYLRELSLNEDINVKNLLLEASGDGENGFSSGNITEDNFDEYLKDRCREAKGIDLEENRVPQIIYIVYEEERPIGILKFRKKLSKYLLERGGNIGYYIKKSERGKGYGTKMLETFLLDIGCKSDIKKFLITCNEDNLISEKVIISNGGILENIIKGTKRYWIEKKGDINEDNNK
jgi:predicted acetyltransferase